MVISDHSQGGPEYCHRSIRPDRPRSLQHTASSYKSRLSVVLVYYSKNFLKVQEVIDEFYKKIIVDNRENGQNADRNDKRRGSNHKMIVSGGISRYNEGSRSTSGGEVK